MLETGPTRADRTLDLMFTNFSSSITESGTVSPLSCDLDSGADSDHRVVFCTAGLETRLTPGLRTLICDKPRKAALNLRI